MVKSLSVVDGAASVVLVDPSGQMKGALHKEIFAPLGPCTEEHLAAGAVLLLHQVRGHEMAGPKG